MLFQQSELPFNDQTWRRINMRKVSHLVGAEVLHNLYNRHWPRINSLRFRHTITNFKDGVVESYAPVGEWTYLQHWLSQKFLAADPILIREIDAIMTPSYDIVNEIMKKVANADLEKLSNQDLALLLIDIVDFPLGDIYKLNVVQIEYSLNFALHKILEKYEPNPLDRNELLARLLAPGELTVSQEEEVAFGKIVAFGRQHNVSDPHKDKNVMSRIQKHYDQYASSRCAYGEAPPTPQEYIARYVFMIEHDSAITTEKEAQENVDKQFRQSQKMLSKLDDELLTKLCQLMARIGVFRDRNKAKLGETVVYRLQILNEIARRTKVPRQEINYYLMAELTALLDTGERLSSKLLKQRVNDGVSFTRNEDVYSGIRPIVTTQDHTESNILEGICASQGYIEAVVKIIRDKEDIEKVSPGDIMVAIGTDFDLLEIMNLSGGIITEEGGLLSHASVVSRELKKPCLIGVSRATLDLHDGDYVKLDATAGEVHIIKRAE